MPENAFVTLAVFDATSSLMRKNPLAAIAAHRTAFGASRDHVLVLKTHGVANAGGEWPKVAAAAAASPNTIVLDQTMRRDDLSALMNTADAVLSLHRSEGFGFVIAEAMSLGVPVVATGWSGNMDFMSGPGTYPVPYRLVPARDPQHTYDLPSALWAEPDPSAAAAYLRAIASCARKGRVSPAVFPLPNYRELLHQS